MVTPDGRRGWAAAAGRAGLPRVCRRPAGPGSAPYIPDLHGPFSPQAPTYEQAVRTVSHARCRRGTRSGQAQGVIGDPALDQFLASQGPAPQNALGAENAWRFSGAKAARRDRPRHLHDARRRRHLRVGRGRRASGAGKGRGSDRAAAPSRPAVAAAGPAALALARIAGDADRASTSSRSTAVALVSAEASRRQRSAMMPRLRRSFSRPASRWTTSSLAAARVRAVTVPTRCSSATTARCSRPVARLARAPDERRAPRPVVQPPVRPNSDSTATAPGRPLATASSGIEQQDGGLRHGGAGQTGVQVFTPAEVRHPYPIVLVHGGLGQAVHMMGDWPPSGMGALLRPRRLPHLCDGPSGVRPRADASRYLR